MKKKTNRAPVPYFSISRDYEAEAADIYIFGDIAQDKGGLAGLLQPRSDESSYNLANQIAEIPEGWEITVHINSNGGELKEGLGIYNVLKDRGVTTVCEGFAASAGSIVFVAGKRRVMRPASLLFLHQAQMEAYGNSDDFAKASEDLRVVTSAAVAAYKEAGLTISDDELMTMLRAETWLPPEDAVRYGFATEIEAEEDGEGGEIMNDAMESIVAMVRPKGTIESCTEAALEVMKAFSESTKLHFEFFELAENALLFIKENPEAIGRIKSLLGTDVTPTPGCSGTVGSHGFFGFGGSR